MARRTLDWSPGDLEGVEAVPRAVHLHASSLCADDDPVDRDVSALVGEPAMRRNGALVLFEFFA